ncbi:MAG: PAS domain S-box protein [Pseudomonadales bacterium]|nr:PAS domain S-box protein [Pseudomonadales bacterium]
MNSGKTVYLRNHTTLLAKDGSEYQITDSATPIRNKENDIQGMVLIFNDVTEQYQLRQRAAKSQRDLQAIMDNSPTVIYVKDTAGLVTLVNSHCENVFSISQERIVGKTLDSIFLKEDADTMQNNHLAVLKSKRAIQSEDTVFYNEHQRIYASINFPIFNEEDQIYAVCCISTDITDRKLQEEQLRRSLKMDALGQLTGGIAHDYNNMLGIIIGYAELLNDLLHNQPKLHEYVQVIQHSAERGARLTQKLLSFTRFKDRDARIKLIHELQLMLEKTLTAP